MLDKSLIVAALVWLQGDIPPATTPLEPPNLPQVAFTLESDSRVAKPLEVIGEVTPEMLESFSAGMAVLEADPKVETIHILINSPGGYVTAGIDIYQLIKHSPKKTQCEVRGMALSAAFLILEGCETRIVDSGSVLLAHGASTDSEAGNVLETGNVGRRLAAFNQMLVEIVSQRSTLTADELSLAFSTGQELWWSPGEALALKLCDAVSP